MPEWRDLVTFGQIVTEGSGNIAALFRRFFGPACSRQAYIVMACSDQIVFIRSPSTMSLSEMDVFNGSAAQL